MLLGWFELNLYLSLLSSLSLNIRFKATKNSDFMLPWSLNCFLFQKLFIKDFRSVLNFLWRGLNSCLFPTWNKQTNKQTNIETWATFLSEFDVLTNVSQPVKVSSDCGSVKMFQCLINYFNVCCGWLIMWEDISLAPEIHCYIHDLKFRSQQLLAETCV